MKQNPSTYAVPRLTFAAVFLFVASLGAGFSPAVQGSSFSEPHTVFYGKVIGTGSAQPFLITEGDLEWSIQKSDGEIITLESSLFSWNEDTFSYRLNVPHSALGLGLEPSSTAVPLPPTPDINFHAWVTVDGVPAQLLGPAGSVFTTEQLLRTAAYRLDIGVDEAAVDTDGDGIPDWWEDLYGFDKQDNSDANQVSTADGLTALEAYLRGLNPNVDNRNPTILTDEILVYPAGTTAILLDAADLNSEASDLIYTVQSLPPIGTLRLRNEYENPASPDLVLSVGGQFTHADLLQGRLVYDQIHSSDNSGDFSLTVKDETAGSESDVHTVTLLSFLPAPLVPEHTDRSETIRLNNHLYASSGYVVMDASTLNLSSPIANPSAGLNSSDLIDYQSTYGDDRAYAFTGGDNESMIIHGGQMDDVLVAGLGSGSMTGGTGGDQFTFMDVDSGTISLPDFSITEGDIIDLTVLGHLGSGFAHEFIRIVPADPGYKLEISKEGAGLGYTNLAVSLPTLAAEDADLYGLISSGNLFVGALPLQSRFTVEATQAQASENGPNDGTFVVSREGSLSELVTVNLNWSGGAQPGVDYQTLPSLLTFESGVQSMELSVVPHQDGQTEPLESVHLSILPGADYHVNLINSAVVTIEDLLMQIQIEALESVAVVNSQSPGTFLITRSDVLNRDVIVRLEVSGSATAGLDYSSIPSFVVMGVNQSVALIPVTPLPGATIENGLENVEMAIKTDTNYRINGDGSAHVSLVEYLDTFASWKQREYPDDTSSLEEFGAEVSGSGSITHFERYAFGLDPNDPDMAGLPRPMVVDGRLVVTFRKPVTVTDVDYTVDAALNLMDWSATQKAIGVQPGESGAERDRVYYWIDDSAADASSAFGVIRAERRN